MVWSCDVLEWLMRLVGHQTVPQESRPLELLSQDHYQLPVPKTAVQADPSLLLALPVVVVRTLLVAAALCCYPDCCH